MGVKFSLDNFRMGYVLAYRTDDSFFNQQIVKKQLKAGFSLKEAEVTHVEISGGGADSINISPPISKRIKITKKHAGRYVYVLRYKNNDYQKRGRYKIAYFSATLNNTGYDIAGILSFLYKWMKHANRLWFCSEGALWALQKVYPKVLDYMKPAECYPADYFSDEFEIVWEGKILKKPA